MLIAWIRFATSSVEEAKPNSLAGWLAGGWSAGSLFGCLAGKLARWLFDMQAVFDFSRLCLVRIFSQPAKPCKFEYLICDEIQVAQMLFRSSSGSENVIWEVECSAKFVDTFFLPGYLVVYHNKFCMGVQMARKMSFGNSSGPQHVFPEREWRRNSPLLRL